jgi:hypothetical protein
MRLAIAAVIGLALPSIPAFTEPPDMELQRCIWRCLAEYKGASDPAYKRCVAKICNDTPRKPKKRRR